jgi:hypothetical protein
LINVTEENKGSRPYGSSNGTSSSVSVAVNKFTAVINCYWANNWRDASVP